MKEAFAAVWLSIVRTVVPVAVGAAVTWLTTMGLNIDPQFEETLTALLFLVATSGYYTVVRLLEVYVSPKFGWLLGNSKSPDTYSATEKGK